MDTIRIAVTVPLAAAVAAGRAQYGESVVELRDADVASLSAGARAELLDGSIDRGALTWCPIGDDGVTGSHNRDGARVDMADVAHVVAWLDARAIDRSAKVAAARARKEAQIAEIVALSLDQWIGTGGTGTNYYRDAETEVYRPTLQESPRGHYLTPETRADARVVARREQAQRELLPGLLSPWTARYEEYNAQRAAEAKAVEDAKAAHDTAIRTLAARYDELARPAAEGYSVERAVLDRVAEELSGSVDAVDRDATSLREAEYLPDRAAPRPEAFAMRDRAEKAVATANENLPAAIGRWTLSRIVRVNVCPHRGEKHVVTAVLATLSWRDTDLRQVIWSTECLECDHDAEEADDERDQAEGSEGGRCRARRR